MSVWGKSNGWNNLRGSFVPREVDVPDEMQGFIDQFIVNPEFLTSGEDKLNLQKDGQMVKRDMRIAIKEAKEKM